MKSRSLNRSSRIYQKVLGLDVRRFPQRSQWGKKTIIHSFKGGQAREVALLNEVW